MKLISIIGTGNYTETQYSFNNKKAEINKYVIMALKEIFNPDKISVIMTDGAEKVHGEKIKELLNNITYSSIKIADGKNEEEIWQIFDSIINAIDENEEIIIDITHGFRSQPILLLAISIYLQTLKNIKIKYILYGAFEAKDENNVAPIFDLTPFLELIAWSFATDDFMKQGNFKLLSKILNDISSSNKSNSFETISKNLSDITDAFDMVRPNEIVSNIKELPKNIGKINETVSHQPNKSKPFLSLLNKINEKYEKIINTTISDPKKKWILAQANIIDIYLDNKQYQQAITLSRELLVQYYCMNKNKDFNKEQDRLQMEDELNEFTYYIYSKHKKHTQNIGIQNIDTQLLTLWKSIRDIRNDINHAGFGKQNNNAQLLITKSKDICNDIINFIKSKNKP